MKRDRSRHFAALIAMAVSVGLVGACTTPGGPVYPGPPQWSYTFKTTNYKVIEATDDTLCTFITPINCHDEPYTLNIAFRVRVGEANSASAWVVEGEELLNDLKDGESAPADAAAQAVTTFPNVNTVDLADLAFGAKLEIAGVWSWAMEGDLTPVSGTANAVKDILLAALQEYVETGVLPEDPNQIVSSLLGSVTFGSVFSVLSTSLASLVFIGDDGVGSRLYLGIGATGTLGSIIDATVGSATIPVVDIPIVGSFSSVPVPPDIEGGRIFRLGALPTFTDHFSQNGDDHFQNSFSFT
ncbi:MAG TPA: hypothetical protein VJM33_12695 [Microthrixaceae bacterium]|nr:hypothetical protein [Microthrixaceae bacterium]